DEVLRPIAELLSSVPAHEHGRAVDTRDEHHRGTSIEERAVTLLRPGPDLPRVSQKREGLDSSAGPQRRAHGGEERQLAIRLLDQRDSRIDLASPEEHIGWVSRAVEHADFRPKCAHAFRELPAGDS